MPRPKKTEAVIPTTSLVASAARYPGNSARIYQPRSDWQAECYRHYGICGEARFAASFFAHAMSRAVLDVRTPGEHGPKVLTTGRSVITLAELFNGQEGQAQMLKAIGLHLTIAGECYLVGREVNGGDTWEIVSVMEMRVTGEKWQIVYGDGMKPVDLTAEDVVIRIWNPHPAKRIEADSPFRSLLPVLSEIEWLTRHIFAQTSSRLAGAGILFLPQGMTFPPPPATEQGTPPETANDADAFMLTLADAMIEPIHNPELPSALVPIVVTAPDDAIDKARLMHFWSELDSASVSLRREAIERFADGMDLPREMVMGMSGSKGTGGGNSNGVSHWGAWQIEESTIKLHIEPMLELVCNALTIGYLRPLLDNDTPDFVGYNTAALRLRPDRSREAFELYDRGVISRLTLLRENGFTDDDSMADDEFRLWLLRKVASGSATPEQVASALKELGVDLGPAYVAEVPRQAPPPPSLDGHPSRPRTPGDEMSALLAAADALVWRALERAGNRIRQAEGVKPPNVPAYSMHTMFHVNGSAERYLIDAWSCAPQVLDGIADVETTVQSLNAYVRTLFAEQAPHSRSRLKEWLEVTS